MPVSIIPGIYRVGGYDLSHIYDEYSFLIVSSDSNKAVIVDTGTGLGFSNYLIHILSILKHINSVDAIINTHCHFPNFGGNMYLRDLNPHINIIAHYPDSYYIRNPDRKICMIPEDIAYYRPSIVSIEINKKEYVYSAGNLELTLIHTPGHTQGSLTVYVELNSYKVALVGGLFDLSAIRAKSSNTTISSIKDLKQSIYKVYSLKPNVLCSSYLCVYGEKNIEKALLDMVKMLDE